MRNAQPREAERTISYRNVSMGDYSLRFVKEFRIDRLTSNVPYAVRFVLRNKSISQHVYRILFLTNHHIGGKCYASYFLKELGRIVSASNFSDISRHHFHTGTLQINIQTF